MPGEYPGHTKKYTVKLLFNIDIVILVKKEHAHLLIYLLILMYLINSKHFTCVFHNEVKK